ncbi:MAG: hypothetical protein ACXU96_16630, partial [Gemmatimonadaceae bacterium]
ALQAYQGLWFGWSGKVASQPASQPRRVDKGRVQYALMDLTSLDRREYVFRRGIRTPFSG